jgi:hypothetical protein
MFDLNGLVPPKTLGTLEAAYGINDAGQIVGRAHIPGSDGTQPAGFMLAPITLIGFKVSPSIVIGGCKTATGKVILSDAAPVQGIVIPLQNTNGAAIVPPVVFVKPGNTAATFVISTIAVAAKVTGSVSATLGDDTLSAPLTVRPIGVKSVTLNPNPTTGGVSVAGWVTLECPAAPGDITVTITSSNPAVANPTTASITIPAGQTAGNFALNTVPVPAITKVKITATANSISKSVTLTVDP